jgi:UDP-glucuronate 4-epimerase
MKLLVTGHAGFIGSHLTDHFLEAGHQVVGLDNRDPFYPAELKEANLADARAHGGLVDVHGDLCDPDTYDRLPGDIDVIVHMAALAGVRPSIQAPARYQEVNVGGSTLLMDFARREGIQRFVFASSSSVYGNNRKVPFSEADRVDHPISPYAATKRAGELLAHTYAHLFGLRMICLRFFTVYGPRQRPDLAIHKFARLLSEDRPIPRYGDGSTRRDYTYIDDIVQGVVGAVEWTEQAPAGSYEIVNLGESRTVSLSEMIQVVAEELGVEARIDERPPQPGDVEQTWADVTRARELLGYEPTTDFREGVRRFVRWFREEGNRA